MPESPASESLRGPDGRTAFTAEKLAQSVHRHLHQHYATTDVRQEGYGPAVFEVDLGDMVGEITIDVRKVLGRTYMP